MNLRCIARSALLLLLLAVCAPAARTQMTPVGDGGTGPFQAQHLRAEILPAGTSVAPGGKLQAALVLTLDDHWHVYWTNAGDSGMPPKIKWDLPSGLTAGPLQFPVPSRLPLGPLTDFGYDGRGVFPVTLEAAADARPGKVHVGALASWLVCREVCIPGKANLGFDITVDPSATAVSEPPGVLSDALLRLPGPLPRGASMAVHGGAQDIVFSLTGIGKQSHAEFYPYDTEQIANAADQRIEPLPDGVQLRVKRAPELTALPATIHGLLKLDDQTGYEFTTKVAPGEVAATSSSSGGGAGALSVGAALGLAFLGGIILNLMPCVFPVLFLKGLALVNSAGEDRGKVARHGLVYTLGILVSFWLIVGSLLLLRAGGKEAGWGFQLQSPAFVAVLAAGLFFFSLSLAGQFDLGLSLTSAGGELAQKQGYTGSFFTGVLATVVATPCTAPLMGAAIGFALSQSAWVAFAVFSALALGLAVPYLALSLQPAWVRVLPRPGAWMETLKQLTSVPLFLTVIWLTWVYGRLYGTAASDHVARLMISFLVLALAGWVLSRWPAQRIGAGCAAALCLLAVAIPLYQSKSTELAWAPYSRASMDAARAAKRPVFIDFTAAWCLSCQVNERLVLRSKEVEQQLKDNHMTLLKADWTQYDPEITRELGAVGRSGVPTYVLYPAADGAQPDVLPELLTKDIVLEAIHKHAGS